MSTTNILDLNNRIDALEKNSGGGSADSAKRSDIASEFSATTAYTAGCFVYYEGKLYQFNADHAAGAWDPTDVVEANVTDQVVTNASAIAGLTASDVAYDNTGSGLIATDAQGAIDEVAGKMGNMRITKLWENSAPTSTFAGQSVEIDNSDYDFLMIGFNPTAVSCTVYQICPAIGDSVLAISWNSGTAAAGATSFRRNLTASTTSVVFADGKNQYTGISDTTENAAVIPTAIYGIKLT